ncbi:golgin subfamily A member 6-like protein 10 [Penaeus indicus]|uniref:golgin subfamily A member 6-like protein 10 n=1 Tax=Penaeus indicus TaxID=29960 RepID=UPI00300D6C0B
MLASQCPGVNEERMVSVRKERPIGFLLNGRDYDYTPGHWGPQSTDTVWLLLANVPQCAAGGWWGMPQTNIATDRTMANTTEEIFNREFYRRYEQMERVLIPKEQYFRRYEQMERVLIPKEQYFRRYEQVERVLIPKEQYFRRYEQVERVLIPKEQYFRRYEQMERVLIPKEQYFRRYEQVERVLIPKEQYFRRYEQVERVLIPKEQYFRRYEQMERALIPKEQYFRRYEQMERVLIPKEQYFQIIDELKQAKSSNSTKSRHEYYLLTRAMFGCEAKVDLTSSSLPDEVIQRVQCEDDLLTLLTTGQNGEEPGPVPSAESAEVLYRTSQSSFSSLQHPGTCPTCISRGSR